MVRNNLLVSISRWQETLEKEKSIVKNDAITLLWKAAIAGFIAADGHIGVRKTSNGMHREVRLFADDDKMRDIFIYAIKKVYNKIPSITWRDNVWHIRLTSKVVVQDLLKIGLYTTKNWRIPFRILNNPETKIAWVKAFFSGEAYVGNHNIRVQIVNEEGMKDVALILKELGIFCRTYQYTPKKKNHSKVFIINIGRSDSIRLYYQKIGFWHQKKSSKLKTMFIKQ